MAGKAPKPIRKADFDPSVRPQDDFYRFVNGGWFKRNSIPTTENRWGSFHVLNQRNRKRLYELLNGLSKKRLKKGSEEAKVRDIFQTALDMKKRNQQGTRYLQGSFDVIDSLQSHRDLPQVLGYLHIHGLDAPWRLWIDQDDKNSKRMVLRIAQGGIGVPSRDYLIKNDKESRRVREAYKRYMARLLALEGRVERKDIPAVVRLVIKVETKLARASMTPVEKRNVHALYNKYTQSTLQKAFPLFRWKEYLDELGVPSVARRHLIIDQPKFLKLVDELFTTLSPAEWRSYLRWHFLDTYAGTLGEEFINESFQYHGKAVQGLEEVPELWKRAVSSATGLMPDAVGKLYVQEYFPPKSKRSIEKLAKNLIRAYRARLQNVEWMSDATKKRALKKLDAISIELGYPKKWQSYRRLAVSRESHARNVLAATRFDFACAMERIAKPTDPHQWDIPVPMVNAFYSPNLNQILFPAGILQPPFFYPDADPAVNYGAIGAVIGHELTHGFDDEGSHFDENGNLRNWWTKGDRERFEARAKVLEQQFNKYRVADGVRVNGKLTLGENIADLGGLLIAYDAFKIATKNQARKKIDGLTPEERFFVSHAISERCLIRDEFVKFLALNDVHAPNEFRSNGPVSNTDAFYDVFDVKKGDALYRSPKSRADIW